MPPFLWTFPTPSALWTAASLTLFSLFPSAVSGAPAAFDCANPKNTIEMGACAEQDLNRADKRLNDAYQRLMKDPRVDDGARKLLRDAQRKWIPFRDAECGFVADSMRGGTGQPVLLTACLGRMTQERAEALEQALQGR